MHYKPLILIFFCAPLSVMAVKSPLLHQLVVNEQKISQIPLQPNQNDDRYNPSRIYRYAGAALASTIGISYFGIIALIASTQYYN